MTGFQIRNADKEDAAAIAAVFTRSRSLLTFLPKLHSAEEDRQFIETVVLVEQMVLVATEASRIVGFITFNDGWIDHLYIDPPLVRQGIGTQLLATVMANSSPLQLWTFQENLGARRFYERHGFAPDQMTDGSGNEEKQPDILYVWSRHAR